MRKIKRFVRNILKKIHFSLKPRTALNLNDLNKLHLGCGDVYIPGFCNVDITKTLAVDIVSDITKLNNFRDNSAELIYACHVLEHLSHKDAVNTLNRWFEVLKPGGELRISVPDIDQIVKIYQENWQHFQTRGNSPWIGLLYGGQVDPYDFHKTGFNFCWLKYLLEEAGYTNVSEYPHEPHFIPGMIDGSMVKAPFGKYLSLNVKASKPIKY